MTQIDIIENNGVVVLTPLIETFDHIAVDRLKTSLLEFIDNGKFQIVLDMKNILHIRSAGIGLLISLHKTLIPKGGKLNISNLNPDCKQVLDFCKVDKKIETFESSEEAVRNMASH